MELPTTKEQVELNHILYAYRKTIEELIPHYFISLRAKDRDRAELLAEELMIAIRDSFKDVITRRGVTSEDN